ncbi:MAG: hypothetical protein ACXVRH_14550 [Thermoleophilaceae bacterium]
MRTALVLALAAALAVAGCGGSHRAPRAPKPPGESVSEQLRQALQQAFHGSLASPPSTARAEVLSCSDLASEGAGAYTCALQPHRSSVPRSLAVKVDPSGGWKTATWGSQGFHGLWGWGLRLPGH